MPRAWKLADPTDFYARAFEKRPELLAGVIDLINNPERYYTTAIGSSPSNNDYLMFLSRHAAVGYSLMHGFKEVEVSGTKASGGWRQVRESVVENPQLSSIVLCKAKNKSFDKGGEITDKMMPVFYQMALSLLDVKMGGADITIENMKKPFDDVCQVIKRIAERAGVDFTREDCTIDTLKEALRGAIVSVK